MCVFSGCNVLLLSNQLHRKRLSMLKGSWCVGGFYIKCVCVSVNKCVSVGKYNLALFSPKMQI